jgi:hypothetical protein
MCPGYLARRNVLGRFELAKATELGRLDTASSAIFNFDTKAL